MLVSSSMVFLRLADFPSNSNSRSFIPWQEEWWCSSERSPGGWIVAPGKLKHLGTMKDLDKPILNPSYGTVSFGFFWSLHLPSEKKLWALVLFFHLSGGLDTPTPRTFLFSSSVVGNLWSALQLWIQSHSAAETTSSPLPWRIWLVGLGTTKVFLQARKANRFRSTGRTCRPRMHQRVRPPKNVEVPKFSSTDTQTKTKVADLCSVVFASTIHNGHLRFIYPPFQTTHRFGYPSLSPNAAEKPRSFHMKTTSLLGAAGEESMNMRESWEGTPLATKVPSWMPKSEWTSGFFGKILADFLGSQPPH